MHDWPTADHHAQRAWRFFEARRWRRALEAFGKALYEDPQRPACWMGRGLALDALERPGEAAAAYARAVALEPEHTEAWQHLGAARLRQGEPFKALNALETAQHLNPHDHASYCHRVAAYARLGDLEQAELMFYLGQQQEPDCPHCFDHVAHALATHGQLDRAIHCWQRARELDPAHPEVGVNLGRCCAFLKQHGRARHFYEQHVADHPEDHEAALELAALLLEMGRLDEAQCRLDDLLTTRPDDDASYHLRGDLALKRGDADAADCCYQRAKQIAPRRAGVRLGLALAARSRGDHAGCIEHLLDELNHSGQDARQVLQLARLLVEQQQYDEADALLTPAVDGFDEVFLGSDTMLAQAFHIRAIAARAKGRLNDMIADCRRALRLDPQQPGCWRMLVRGYLDQNRPTRARAALNRATTLCPNDPHLRKLNSQLRWQRLTRPRPRKRAA